MTPFREIHTRVVRILVEALGVDEDDVTPSATLQGDLGASRSTFWTSSSAWSASSGSRSRGASCSRIRSSRTGPISWTREGSPIGAWWSCGRGCPMPTSPTSSASGVSVPSPTSSRSGWSSGMSNGSSVRTAGGAGRSSGRTGWTRVAGGATASLAGSITGDVSDASSRGKSWQSSTRSPLFGIVTKGLTSIGRESFFQALPVKSDQAGSTPGSFPREPFPPRCGRAYPGG